MTLTAARLADARARVERGASLDATADFLGVSVVQLRKALASKLVPVRVVEPRCSVVVTAGPLRIEGLTLEDIARLVSLCSG